MHTVESQWSLKKVSTVLELEGVSRTAVLGQKLSLTSPVVAPQMIVMKLKKVNRPVYWAARLCCGDNMAPPAIAD